jgi:16S rRNA (guanine(966)-N(2))-methyltransferase RsmD
MRIIGGVKKGLLLRNPHQGHIRPTSEMMREAFFNMIPHIESKVFLDLFAGTGSIGLEALSRGAANVIFVEKNRELARFLQAVLLRFGFERQGQVFCTDVKSGIIQVARMNLQCDYIFIDPPYEKGFITETINLVAETAIAARDGWVIIQHSRREPVVFAEKDYSFERQRVYGDSALLFLKPVQQMGSN